jgi:pyrroloquinoline quinone (PQQ) biosynthesis protein C
MTSQDDEGETMANNATEPLPREEFIKRMKDIHSRYSVMTTQFMQEFVDGKVPIEGLKGFAVSHWFLCDVGAYGEIEEVWTFRNTSEDLLHSTTENVVGEIGYLPDGLAPHPQLAKNLCYGLGMTDEEIENTEIVPEMLAFIENGNRSRGVDQYTQTTMRGAYGILEVDSAISCTAIGKALLEKYGVDEHTASYFIAHGYRDIDHGDTNLETSADLAQTREEQEEALKIAEGAMASRRRLYQSYRSYYGEPG